MNHYNCIYCYTNTINGKKYIGQAKDLRKRHIKHISASKTKRNARDYNTPFHRALRKYGEESFFLEVLEFNLSEEELNEKKDTT